MAEPKLIIIGLDGGTYKIIDPLISEGKLPNIKKLIDNGTRTTLRSTIPPLTAPAWVTLMTGVNPGKHGLFDFIKLNKLSYETPVTLSPKETCNLVHSSYYKGKTLWDIFSNNNLKTSVIMMPMTYPAWQINGYMLSGYPSPDLKKPSGYPLEWLSTIGPLFDLSVIKINNEDKLIAECKKLVNKVEAVLIEQIINSQCDIHCVVFSSTDFLQHYLWKYLSDIDNKYSDAIRNIYMEIDKSIGKIMELVSSKKTTFVVLSDHGFTSSPEKYFHINAWLIREGYLAVKHKADCNGLMNYILNPLRYRKVGLRLFLRSYYKYLPNNLQKKLSDIYYNTNQFSWNETKAFSHRLGTVEGIVINMKGRQSSGFVEKTEYEALRNEIIEKLKDIRDDDNNLNVVKSVFKREEIYKGKFVDLVPDIIFMTESKYCSGVGVDKKNIIEHIPTESVVAISGVHDMDGILIMSGPNIKGNNEIQPVGIIDVFPTILYDLQLSIPNYIDGTVIVNAFREEFSSVPALYFESALYEGESNSLLSENEEESMKKALKSLGYLS
jgi:predicted AlkP superfamily phosphohydrolase/phosphomutase